MDGFDTQAIAYVAPSIAEAWGLNVAAFGPVCGAQIGLNAVTAASYPTGIRATGIGWALGVGRVGSILGPTAGGLLLGLGWSPQSLLIAAVAPALTAAVAVLALSRCPPIRAPISRG
jgi:AAHS family 4-hydroxybenzoate transporter-like MFS transporter